MRHSAPIMKLGSRLITGLIGSLWAGLSPAAPFQSIIRSVFQNVSQGASMQCSCVLLNLHEAASAEQALPETLHLSFDNTSKESKNNTFLAFIIHTLIVLKNTRLSCVRMHMLMVGHTHDSLVRPSMSPITLARMMSCSD
jgi:hypothetical protein